MRIQQDRNFDSLLERFEQTVYNTAKGNWRLKLLKEDLNFLTTTPPLTVWDAGCGLAQISYWLAQHGHKITLCDLSEKMLTRAKQQFKQGGIAAEFHHSAAQPLARTLPLFDVILFHAVLEWLVAPQESLALVSQQVKPGGYLSLLFYNRNAMIYKNVLQGGWRLPHILDGRYLGKGKNLSPPNPQLPEAITNQLQGLGFKINTYTGIRVFHDYLSEDALKSSDEAELFALEHQHCRLPTFREMGRYIHLLAQRAN